MYCIRNVYRNTFLGFCLYFCLGKLVFLLLLPLALLDPSGGGVGGFRAFWHDLAIVPAVALVSIFLFGIAELAVQLEEPFSILPLQHFCDEVRDSCNNLIE